MGKGKRLLRARKALSPCVTSMITAGSVRGKCWEVQAGLVHWRTCPPSAATVGAPQVAQNPWRLCQ